MLIKKSSPLKFSDITPKDLYLNRRQFLQQSSTLTAFSLLSLKIKKFWSKYSSSKVENKLQLKIVKKDKYRVDETITPYEEATSYTNFYEFSTGKRSVKRLSQDFRTRPWTVKVEGLVEKPQEWSIDELLNMFPLEERIYRWRCVEAWSMVIPWVGFPLASLLKKVKPTSEAKFVEFIAVFAPAQMPGQKTNVLEWPYREGLRLDEATHPLTLLAVGMYGELLPNQNGAPLRLVVPWKYGFKSIKSIVKIRITKHQPKTTWVKANPREYGFYANVNPHVDHPRWSQATERRIGESGRRKTLMFNGYGDEVAYLYQGMDLKKYF